MYQALGNFFPNSPLCQEQFPGAWGGGGCDNLARQMTGSWNSSRVHLEASRWLGDKRGVHSRFVIIQSFGLLINVDQIKIVYGGLASNLINV